MEQIGNRFLIGIYRFSLLWIIIKNNMLLYSTVPNLCTSEVFTININFFEKETVLSRELMQPVKHSKQILVREKNEIWFMWWWWWTTEYICKLISTLSQNLNTYTGTGLYQGRHINVYPIKLLRHSSQFQSLSLKKIF